MAFVLGCGIGQCSDIPDSRILELIYLNSGVLIRMFFVLTVLAIRAFRRPSRPQPIQLTDEQVASMESITICTPAYGSDEKSVLVVQSSAPPEYILEESAKE